MGVEKLVMEISERISRLDPRALESGPASPAEEGPAAVPSNDLGTRFEFNCVVGDRPKSTRTLRIEDPRSLLRRVESQFRSKPDAEASPPGFSSFED